MPVLSGVVLKIPSELLKFSKLRISKLICERARSGCGCSLSKYHPPGSDISLKSCKTKLQQK